VVAALGLGLATGARGQETVRMSEAGAAAAEARQKAATTAGYYNLQLGPTTWTFTGGLGVEYNSNVYSSESDPQGDLIFRPQINTRMLWPVSDVNSINLTLGGGYSAYLDHSSLDRFFINPGSELSFDLYIGDFWINLHDRFSITEDTYQDPSVAGYGNYSQLQNALGVTAVWDLNKGMVKAGYDHVNYESLSGANNSSSQYYYYGSWSGYSEVFSASAGYTLKPGKLLGVELGDSLMTYTTSNLVYTTTGTNTTYPNANQWNVGGFYDTKMSEYIHCIAHAGYTLYSPETSGTSTTSGDQGGVYVQLDFTHRVNPHLTYSLSGGRTFNISFNGGAIDRYFASGQLNWRVFEKLTLGTSFSYEHGSQLVTGGEIYDQYGPGISLSRPITATAKLTTSLGYQFYWRDSNWAGRNYLVSVVSLNMNYKF